MGLTLTLDQVEELAHTALRRAGASAAQAAPVALSLRDAEAEGIRAVGLGYLPLYCTHLRLGKIAGDAVPEVTQVRPATLRADAKDGFAHPAYLAGEARLIEMARAEGLAAMAVTNSYASGVVGWFADRLARAGLVALATTNGSRMIAPWGGRTPFFGTNPYAFAAPRAGAALLVIDSSSSATARINVFNAAAEGRPIPDTWALDAEGLPTTDAAEGLKGSIAPAGGYKGVLLALMVETLSAGLSGSEWSHESGSLTAEDGEHCRIGQFYLAIDPDAFGASGLAQRLDVLLAAMTEEEGTRTPGDRRHASRARAEREGVVVEEPLASELAGLAGGLPE